MNHFDATPRTRIVFGADTIDRLGELARTLGTRRALLVTDTGIEAAGHVERGARALEAAQIEVVVFNAVRENPTTLDVDRCLAVARENAIDTFIGLGGGSSLDTAKGANFLLTNGGRMQDYWGVGKAARNLLPMIAAPTTAGTGSECQSFALIADEETHQKMACGDPKAAPAIALLDPTLTLSQPPYVTACTGMDAIVHAVETAVTTRRTPYSALFSQEAFRLVIGNFERVLGFPNDLEARGRMLLGAAYAGIAIENSMLGAAHSAANPLTAHYNIVHGQAVGMTLPHVLRFNAEQPETRTLYRDLALQAGLISPTDSEALALSALLQRLEACLRAAGMPATLAECGVTEEAIPTLAAEAARQWTANFNPRPLTVEDFTRLYRNAL